jgi:hypothetical protein
MPYSCHVPRVEKRTKEDKRGVHEEQQGKALLRYGTSLDVIAPLYLPSLSSHLISSAHATCRKEDKRGKEERNKKNRYDTHAWHHCTSHHICLPHAGKRETAKLIARAEVWQTCMHGTSRPYTTSLTHTYIHAYMDGPRVV